MLKRGWEYPQDVQRNVYTDDAGVTWHLLDCRYAFGDWIEQHSNKLWRMEGLPHPHAGILTFTTRQLIIGSY